MHRIAIAILALLSVACTPTTDIVNSWNPQLRENGPMNHLVIMAITTNDRARKRYENACEKVFAGEVKQVTVSHDIFREWSGVNRENMRREIERRGVDGFLTTQLAGTQYSTASLPDEDLFDRNAIRFYRPAVSYNYKPELDRLPEHPVYLGLSNFYLIGQQSLVWTVMTQTPGGVTQEEVARSQCRALLQGMRERGYLE